MMAFPDRLKDIGLPFDDAYVLAVQMRGGRYLVSW
jgi:hypothetical protein